MQMVHPLESVAWGASANRLIKLDTLPAGTRLYELHLFFDLSGTKTAAADALTADLFARCIASLKLGKYVNIDGWGLTQLMNQVYGRIVGRGTDIAAAGATFDMEFELVIPFRNPRQPAASDGAIPVELLHGKALELTFTAADVWGVGTLAVTAGNVRCQAELVHETNIPQLAEIGYKDPGAQTVQMEPGVYLDAFICDGPTPGTVTAAEVTSLDFDVDGQPVWNSSLHEQIIAAYNHQAVRDTAAQLTIGGATRVPFVWQDCYGKAELSKQPVIETSGRLQITGTMAAPRVYYWRVLPKDPATVQRVAEVTGAPRDATDYEPTTASKTALRQGKNIGASGNVPKKVRVLSAALPGKLRKPGTLNK